MNLRSHIANAGLARMLEGNFALPIILDPPDGSEGTMETAGQVLYDKEQFDPDTGDLVSIRAERATIRNTSVARVPIAGEKWKIQIPTNPGASVWDGWKTGDTIDLDYMTTYLLNIDESPVDGKSAGFTILKLKEADQSC